MNWRFRLTCFTLALLLPLTFVLGQDGGNVMPPQARPYGYSLTDMAKVIALLNTGQHPSTPFQFLDYDSNNVQWAEITCANGQQGVYSFAANSFLVRPGTYFYLPLLYVDDSPPVIEPFPSDRREAQEYLYSPEFFGYEKASITVDRRVTPITPDYVSGIVEQTNPPLLDGGTHMFEVAAFLTPLAPGKHVVMTYQELDGAAVLTLYGNGCYHAASTFLIEVKDGSD